MLYLESILEALTRVEAFTAGLTFECFIQKTKYAVVHGLQIVGEAVRHVPDTIREAYPEVPWHEIRGMRNRIVHDYLDVDYDIGWQVVRQDVPLLRSKIRRIMDDFEV